MATVGRACLILALATCAYGVALRVGLGVVPLWRSLVLSPPRGRLRDVAPSAPGVLLGLGAFSGGLLVSAASPFPLLPTPPQEGIGLNALLRHPSMMIHP